MGLPNLNMKGKTKRILVLVVKRHHRVNGPLPFEEALLCSLISPAVPLHLLGSKGFSNRPYGFITILALERELYDKK